MNQKIENLKLADLAAYSELLVQSAINLGAAIVIFLIGMWLARFTKRRIISLSENYEAIDLTLTIFLGTFAHYTIVGITILIVLTQFGVQTTSLIALLGAAGLAIGLALQGTLSNVAAGLMILFLRPFKVGNFIETGGVSGTVKQINIFSTEIATGDNVQVHVPNARIWGAAINNFSGYDRRRLELIPAISYSDDIEKAMKIIRQVISKDARIHPDPEPVIGVIKMADFSVNIRVRVWCDNAEYWDVTYDLNKNIKEAFDKADITIPFPTRTIYAAAPPAPESTR